MRRNLPLPVQVLLLVMPPLKLYFVIIRFVSAGLWVMGVPLKQLLALHTPLGTRAKAPDAAVTAIRRTLENMLVSYQSDRLLVEPRQKLLNLASAWIL